MSEYDLRNMTKVELYRNWRGQLFVNTESSQVGGTNQWLRLDVIGEDGSRNPIYLSEPKAQAMQNNPEALSNKESSGDV